MKHTTMLGVYKTILHDDTITHHDFVKIVAYMQRYNGSSDKSLTKKLKEQPIIIKTGMRGRPLGSKNKQKLDEVFSRPNDKHGE